jgi:hypothetical protein
MRMQTLVTIRVNQKEVFLLIKRVLKSPISFSCSIVPEEEI